MPLLLRFSCIVRPECPNWGSDGLFGILAERQIPVPVKNSWIVLTAIPHPPLHSMLRRFYSARRSAWDMANGLIACSGG